MLGEGGRAGYKLVRLLTTIVNGKGFSYSHVGIYFYTLMRDLPSEMKFRQLGENFPIIFEKKKE